MSESVFIALISTIGVTFFTGIFAVIQQGMAMKKTTIGQQQIKSVANDVKATADGARQESKESFEDLKAILIRQQTILSHQQQLNKAILRDRLRFLLKQYQDKDTVPFADKEDIDMMFKLYKDDGNNGTIEAMYKEFANRKVI